MDFLLNEDQQMIHELAQQFAQDVLQPRIDEIEAGVDVQVKDGSMQKQQQKDFIQLYLTKKIKKKHVLILLSTMI